MYRVWVDNMLDLLLPVDWSVDGQRKNWIILRLDTAINWMHNWLIVFAGVIYFRNAVFLFKKFGLSLVMVNCVCMWMYLFWLDWVIGEAGEGKDEVKPTLSPYEEAMEALSSLITKRSRADKSNKGDKYELLFDYIKVVFLVLSLFQCYMMVNCWYEVEIYFYRNGSQILELEEPIKQMKVIHVAGTKGKVNELYGL